MKRAPTKKRLAIVLDREGNIAGLDDDRGTYERIELLEEGAEETVLATLREDPAELVSVLDEMGVTDIVAQHYEESTFGSLRGEGVALWLAAPETSRTEAIREWHENRLMQAATAKPVVRKGHVVYETPPEGPPQQPTA